MVEGTKDKIQLKIKRFSDEDTLIIKIKPTTAFQRAFEEICKKLMIQNLN